MSLRGASDLWNTGSGGLSNGESPLYSIAHKADWVMISSESDGSTSASTAPSSDQVNNSPSEDISASQPYRDYVSSIEAEVRSAAHPLLDEQQCAYQKAVETLDPSQGHLATRIYQLKYDWTRLFCQRPLPALILLFIMNPAYAKVGAPVTFRPVSYQPALYHLEEYLRVSCGGLLQIVTDTAQDPNARRYPFANSVEYEVERLKVKDTTETIAQAFAMPDMRNRLQETAEQQSYDALESFANACILVLKSTDPSRDSIFHRYLMYLAHILRNATHFSEIKTGFYLDRVGELIQQCQMVSSSPSSSQQKPAQSVRTLYHLTPLAHYRPNDSLHLKPDIRCHADIYTFAAEEALLHPYTELHVSDPTHRFAVTAHALCSWMYRSTPDQTLQVFIPTLQQRKTTLRHLLTNIVSPESSACDGMYSLWWEVMRNYNKGALRDPMDLMAVFLGASLRPDILWAQTLRPMVEASMVCRLQTLKEALEAEMQYAVAPELFQYCVGELMMHLCKWSV
jgi:hypothetical protein